MPRGIEQLTSLQILHPYVVRKEDHEVTELPERSSGIEQLHDLNLLEELLIIHLENVRGPIDAERANLKGKLHIRKLELVWGDWYRIDDVVVLEALQPHPNLKELVVDGFMGSWFPMWMGSGVSSSCLLINLVELNLRNCKRCEQLPALGLLPSLRILCISGMKSLRRMGEELYAGGGEFPSLIKLSLKEMESLEEWVSPPPHSPSNIDIPGTSFPLLEQMTISGCPKLTTTPTSFPSLKKLSLWYSNGEALCSIARGSLTSLTSLTSEDLPELIYFPRGLLRCLQNLEIVKCNNFRGFRDGGNISDDEDEVTKSVSGTHELFNHCCSLQSLTLRNCPSLTFLPDLQGLTTLRRLTINNCNDELKKYLPYDWNCLSFIEELEVDFLENHSQSSN